MLVADKQAHHNTLLPYWGRATHYLGANSIIAKFC